MRKTMLVMLVSLFLAIPVLADEMNIEKKGGGSYHPQTSVVVSGGALGGGLYNLLPRTSQLSVNGNQVNLLGSKFGYAYLEYDDGSTIFSQPGVYLTLTAKKGHAIVWFVAVEKNGYEWKRIWAGEVNIK